MNATEQEEKEYLEEIKEKLTLAIRRIDGDVRQFSDELREKKQYIHEHQSGMDDADMVAAGQSINRMAFTGEAAVGRKRKLLKLGQSPYFGRIDFVPEGKSAWPVYIGMYSFMDERQRQSLIYDWRAPIASMFYDFELGEASFTTPAGPMRGVIERKRQYKIRDGRMEFMLENDVNIHDDVLQRELAKSSDDKLKNIVATIQRDQNAVIRNETAPVMVIQGVAGSGKTSIALHRIAFLLYRYRETIAAKDVLIISPNKVFADYISNVLPELGEEHIPELGMEELAADLLGHQYPFQTFFEQVSALLEQPHPAFIERIRYKSSFEFLGQLNQYLLHVENHYFTVTELRVGRTLVPLPFLLAKFRTLHRVPLLKRFALVAEEVRAYVRNAAGRKLTNHEKATIGEAIPRMFKFSSGDGFVPGFLPLAGPARTVPNRPPPAAGIRRRIRLHLPAHPAGGPQYLRPCEAPTRGRDAGLHARAVRGAGAGVCLPQDHSGRCEPDGEPVQRLLGRNHRARFPAGRGGAPLPQLPLHDGKLRPSRSASRPTRTSSHWSGTGRSRCSRASPAPMRNCREIKRLITTFQSSGNHSLGIICKTLRQAEEAFQALKASDVYLLTDESTTFKEGIIITTAHLAKGLEFDEVIVPFASARTYQTEVDKSMLYVACTRAMHRLTLTFSGGGYRVFVCLERCRGGDCPRPSLHVIVDIEQASGRGASPAPTSFNVNLPNTFNPIP